MLSHDKRIELAAVRTKMIKEKTIDSPEYFKQLIQDCEAIIDIEQPGLDEVCKQLNIRDDIVINSQESHIGSVQHRQKDYIRDFLDLYQFHPYKGQVNEDKEESIQVAQAILDKACWRFGQEDVKGAFESEEQFIYVYHMLCIDIARTEFELEEAEFLSMFNEHDLSSEDIIKAVHEDLADKLMAQLDQAPTEDDEVIQ